MGVRNSKADRAAANLAKRFNVIILNVKIVSKRSAILPCNLDAKLTKRELMWIQLLDKKCENRVALKIRMTYGTLSPGNPAAP